MVHFLKFARTSGWRFNDPNSHALDFFKLLRAAANDGEVTVYGVRAPNGTLAELDSSPVKIDKDHWKDFEFDCMSCFQISTTTGWIEDVTPDNKRTKSKRPPHETGHVDLWLDDKQATEWLAQSLIPLENAARKAREISRHTIFESTSANSLTWFANYFVQKVPLYGTHYPSGAIEKVPTDNSYPFVQDGENLIMREYAGKETFANIKIRKNDLESALNDMRVIIRDGVLPLFDAKEKAVGVAVASYAAVARLTKGKPR